MESVRQTAHQEAFQLFGTCLMCPPSEGYIEVSRLSFVQYDGLRLELLFAGWKSSSFPDRSPRHRNEGAAFVLYGLSAMSV